MNQPEVPSPCTGVCRLDAAEICVGCGRTLAEIAAWSAAGDEQKREISRLAEARLAQAASRATKP